MKLKIFTFVVILTVISTLTSCSQIQKNNETTSSFDTTHSTATNDNVIESGDLTSSSDEEYNAKMDINSYMRYLVNYFHEPYNKGDKISDKNILSLSFLVSLSNKDYLDFVKINEQTLTMHIEGEGLRWIAKNLFSDDILLSEYHHYMENSADLYYSEEDRYIVAYARGYWGGDMYYLDEKAELEIVESDNTLTVTATVQYIPQLGTIASVQKLAYTFDKVVENDFLFYRLNKAEIIQ